MEPIVLSVFHKSLLLVTVSKHWITDSCLGVIPCTLLRSSMINVVISLCRSMRNVQMHGMMCLQWINKEDIIVS